MSDPSGDAIQRIEKLLDETARRCLRLISTQQLSPTQYRKLAQFMFGCMNQKGTLAQRVEQRGPGELRKILRFAAKAAEVILEIAATTP